MNGEAWGGTFHEPSCDNMRLIYRLVVVRTGDRTFIGKSSSIVMYTPPDMSSTGQIARLTGGETGKQSPLAVEMYVPSKGLRMRAGRWELTKNLTTVAPAL